MASFCLFLLYVFSWSEAGESVRAVTVGWTRKFPAAKRLSRMQLVELHKWIKSQYDCVFVLMKDSHCRKSEDVNHSQHGTVFFFFYQQHGRAFWYEYLVFRFWNWFGNIVRRGINLRYNLKYVWRLAWLACKSHTVRDLTSDSRRLRITERKGCFFSEIRTNYIQCYFGSGTPFSYQINQIY